MGLVGERALITVDRWRESKRENLKGLKFTNVFRLSDKKGLNNIES